MPVALSVKTVKDGSYTFSLAEEWTRNSNDISHLYLYDSKADTYTDLLNDTYTVSLASGKHNNRFSLLTERHALPTNTDFLAEDGFSVSRSADGLSISGLDGEAYVRVFNTTGSCVFSAVTDGDVRISLSRGVYVVQVTKDNRTYTFKTAAE